MRAVAHVLHVALVAERALVVDKGVLIPLVRHVARAGAAPAQSLCDVTAMFVARYGNLQPGQRIFIRTSQQVDGMADVPKLV